MAEPKKAVVIDLMTAMKSHLNALPICPRCNRREPRLDYCAGCDRELCPLCHRDHKECAE